MPIMPAFSMCLLAFLLAQDPSEKSADSVLVRGWLKVSQDHATDYDIAPADAPDKKFRLLPQPVFRHAQPTRGNDIGAVYLWVDADDRPVVVGTVFAWAVNEKVRNVTHEFHSLADMPLKVRWREKEYWSPKTPGLEWKPIPDAPKPADSKVTRSRQIREQVRRFTANSLDPKDSRWELRLITQPIHQFEIPEPKQTQAGALFAFCQGTDPELFVAIESRRSDDGFRWHYACASFTDFRLQVRLDGKDVWSIGRYVLGRTDVPHWVQSMIPRMSLPEDAADGVKK